MVREFIPDAEINFDDEGGLEQSDIYLVDNSRMREEFEVEILPYRQRVLEIINEVRQAEGMAPIARVARGSGPSGCGAVPLSEKAGLPALTNLRR